MKLFYVCPPEVWHELRPALLAHGLPAPTGSQAWTLGAIKTWLPSFNNHNGERVRAVVAHHRGLTPECAGYLSCNFPGVPVLKFTFDTAAIKSTGWGWYADAIGQALNRMPP